MEKFGNLYRNGKDIRLIMCLMYFYKQFTSKKWLFRDFSNFSHENFSIELFHNFSRIFQVLQRFFSILCTRLTRWKCFNYILVILSHRKITNKIFFTELSNFSFRLVLRFEIKWVVSEEILKHLNFSCLFYYALSSAVKL